MKLARPEYKALIILLVKRTVLFIFVFCLLLLFLYGVGTAQDFLDSTQIALLKGASVLGLLLLIGAVYGIALDIGAAIAQKDLRFFLGAAMYLLLAAFGAGSAVITSFILVIVAGNVG